MNTAKIERFRAVCDPHFPSVRDDNGPFVKFTDYEALQQSLTASEQQAKRYQWLAQRIEISPAETMSGQVKDAMDFKIGQSVIASRPRPPCDTSALDAAIDAQLAKEPK